MFRTPRLAIATLAAMVLTLSGAAPAMADGVPSEVETYIATELIDDLNEFYGPGTDGAGLLFTNSTTSTPAQRVFTFTDDFATGIDSEPAVRRVNQWVTVLAIDEQIVGLAIVSIEPVTVAPQLDLYIASPEFGTVVAALPETAALVNDKDREAWFALDGEDTLTPLVAGSSCVTEPTTLEAYRALVGTLPTTPTDAAPASAMPPSGLIIVGLIAVLIVLLLAVEVFFPFWRRRAAQPARPDEPLEPEPAATPRAPRKKPTASD